MTLSRLFDVIYVSEVPKFKKIRLFYVSHGFSATLDPDSPFTPLSNVF